MPITLDIKLPDGTQAPVHAYHTDTLINAIEILSRETGIPGYWGSMVEPWTTKNEYKWDLFTRTKGQIRVTLPAGSTINIYR